jgi:hypothetical protein
MTSPHEIVVTAVAPRANDEYASADRPAPKQVADTIATGSLGAARTAARTYDRMRFPVLMIGVAAIGSLLASTFFMWRRRLAQSHVAVHAGRDFATVSWDGELPSPERPLEEGQSTTTATACDDPRSVAGQAGEGGAKAASSVETVPKLLTLAEAYDVVGASPDAGIEVVKKIVEGLRQSWHPDLAKSDEDRLGRERRTRQINYAWELISAGRQAAG